MFGDDVADVVDDDVLLVPLFQLLEEPESRGKEVLATGREHTGPPWNRSGWVSGKGGGSGKPEDELKPGEAGSSVNTSQSKHRRDQERGRTPPLKIVGAQHEAFPLPERRQMAALTARHLATSSVEVLQAGRQTGSCTSHEQEAGLHPLGSELEVIAFQVPIRPRSELSIGNKASGDL